MSLAKAILIINAAKKGWTEEARKKAALTRKRKAVVESKSTKSKNQFTMVNKNEFGQPGGATKYKIKIKKVKGGYQAFVNGNNSESPVMKSFDAAVRDLRKAGFTTNTAKKAGQKKLAEKLL